MEDLLPSSRLPLTLSLLLVAGALAGCLGGENEKDPLDGLPTVDGPVDASLLRGGRDLRLELLANDTLDVPQWQLGQWFGHHVILGGGDSAGFHINTAVVKDLGASWLVATDDPEIAKIEVAYDIPIIGELKKTDLSTTAFGVPWDWLYQFPLTDGKTWTKDVQMQNWETGEIVSFSTTFAVAFNDAIQTPDGPRPGFEIAGTTADGDLLVFSDYTPDIGWYAHFYMYDPFTPDDAEDFQFHVMSMGHGVGWKGTYLDATGAPRLELVSGTAFVANENLDPAIPPYAAPNPYATFTVSEGATDLYGFVFGFAFGGAQALVLLDPANTHHPWYTAGMGGFEQEISIPAVAGEWKVASPSAGVVAIEGLYLWEVTLTPVAFEPPAAETA